MGLVHSYDKLSEPVTLNRMRFVCQRNSGLPSKLQRFNIELLANDLNKIGFNIKTTDAKGKQIGSDKLCGEIYKARPNIEQICMINSSNGNASSKNIAAIVEFFNNYFGTNIPLTENPMDPNSKRRTIPALCDDLYLVGDKMSRSLADDLTGVKTSLIDQIKKLRQQQGILDDSFTRHMSYLKSGLRSPTSSASKLDALKSALEESKNKRNSMMGELNGQLEHAKKLGIELETNLNSRFFPHVKHVAGVLNKYATTPYNGTLQNMQMQVGNILQMVPAMVVSAQQCKTCLNKFDAKVDEWYKDPSKRKEFAEGTAIDQKYAELLREANGNASEIASIQSCYNQLKHDYDTCARNTGRANNFVDSTGMKEVCTSLNAAQCAEMPFCKTNASGSCEIQKDALKTLIAGKDGSFVSEYSVADTTDLGDSVKMKFNAEPPKQTSFPWL